jgi:hypothetical protein
MTFSDGIEGKPLTFKALEVLKAGTGYVTAGKLLHGTSVSTRTADKPYSYAFPYYMHLVSVMTLALSRVGSWRTVHLDYEVGRHCMDSFAGQHGQLVYLAP